MNFSKFNERDQNEATGVRPPPQYLQPREGVGSRDPALGVVSSNVKIFLSFSETKLRTYTKSLTVAVISREGVGRLAIYAIG